MDLSELINEFGKAAGYKINTQNLLVLLYVNSKIWNRNWENNPIYNSYEKQYRGSSKNGK